MIVALVGLLGAPALAATLTVDPADGAAYPTIGAAVAASSSGDTIQVAAGTYAECIDPDGRDLIFSGPGVTVDGSGLCSAVFTVDAGEQVTLEDVVLTNATGRGLVVVDSTVALTRVVISGAGTADASGGALYGSGGTLVLTECVFAENTASEGGAIYLYRGTSLSDTGSRFEGNTATTGAGGAINLYWEHNAEFVDTHFEGNTAAGSSGGAIGASWSTTLRLEDTTFVDNTASGSGGGVYLYALSTTVEVLRSTFDGNTAQSGWGGALESEWYSSLDIVGSTFSGNTADRTGGAVGLWYQAAMNVQDTVFVGNQSVSDGGGALAFQPDERDVWPLTVDGSTFENNTAAGNGGAVAASWVGTLTLTDSVLDGNIAGESSAGGALMAYVAVDATIARTRFCGNTAATGGAVSMHFMGTDSVLNSTFVDNTADNGGGLHRYASYAAFTNQNTFVGNAAGQWGGAYYADWAYSEFRNNAVYDSVGDGIYATNLQTSSGSTLAHDAWGGNALVDVAGAFWMAPGVDGHVVGDAAFVSYTPGGPCGAHDLRPGPGSVLIDAGDPLLADLWGGTSDIGAFGGPGAAVEDRDGDGADTTEDCADGDPAVNPAAAEVCDGLDNDCDGTVDGPDARDAQEWFPDGDGDGHGSADGAVMDCSPGEGWAAVAGDCDDTAADAHPGAVERWYDGRDQDCDGADDFDADGDGHQKQVGDNGGLDCDDGDPAVNPDAFDLPGDGLDQDCDGWDAVPLPEDEDPDDAVEPADGGSKDAGGCATVHGGSTAGWVLGGLFLWRRRRRATRA